MKKYNQIKIFTLVASTIFGLTAEPLIFDAVKVKTTLTQHCSLTTSSNPSGYSYWQMNQRTNTDTQLLKKIITKIVNAHDPVTEFLKQADSVKISEHTKQNIIEKVIQESPEAFCVYAQYMLQATNNWGDDEQSFITDWKNGLIGTKDLTQTCAHLSTPSLTKPFDFFKNGMYQPQLIRAAVKEQQLIDSGYFVFYHGQENYFGFYQDFWKDLLDECFQQRIVTYKLPNDFFFIRMPQHLKEIINSGLSTINCNAAISARKNIMQGITNYNLSLSVNGFLFGSTGIGSCSTWNFVISNSNCSYCSIRLEKQIFESLECSSIAHTFKKTLRGLNREHSKFFKSGRLLQIAIPHVLVDDCVFISSGGAHKASVNPSGTILSINKVTQQMPYCKKRDTNAFGPQYGYHSEYHFGIAMTEDMALNPRSGIKVFGYNSVPALHVQSHYGGKNHTVTYAEHKQKRAKLINDITAAMKNIL